jgi:hypothetical protein
MQGLRFFFFGVKLAGERAMLNKKRGSEQLPLQVQSGTSKRLNSAGNHFNQRA